MKLTTIHSQNHESKNFQKISKIFRKKFQKNFENFSKKKFFKILFEISKNFSKIEISKKILKKNFFFEEIFFLEKFFLKKK